MAHSTTLALFVFITLAQKITAEYCYAGRYLYYCSPGQTCGTYYGDCRGLPTYAIIAIVSTSLVVLSVCIRCCVQVSARKRSLPITSVGNPSHLQTSACAVDVSGARRSQTSVPIHSVAEGAPPSYATVMSSAEPPPKY